MEIEVFTQTLQPCQQLAVVKESTSLPQTQAEPWRSAYGLCMMSLMRCVVRAAYLGEETGDLSALENPLAVEEIVRAL